MKLHNHSFSGISDRIIWNYIQSVSPPFLPNRPHITVDAMPSSFPYTLERSCLLNKTCQFWGISPMNFTKLRTIFPQNKGWHCSYANFHGNFFLFVDINFIESDMAELRSVWYFLKNRRDGSARSTPWSPEINDNRIITINKFLELREPTILLVLAPNNNNNKRERRRSLTALTSW